jgi:hypothetical protein
MRYTVGIKESKFKENMHIMDSNWVRSIWKSNSTSSLPDVFKAKRLVTESYGSGLISWNTYNSALDRIRRV